MIHILSSGLSKPADNESVLALYNALQEVKQDAKIEIFEECKGDIFKWSGDVVFLVNSEDKSELDSILAHLCVCNSIYLFLVNDNPELNFKHAVTERVLRTLEQRQSNEFRTTLLVPATACIKTYAKHIFDANISAISCRLHSLLRFKLRKYADYKNKATDTVMLHKYSPTYAKFGIVDDFIDAVISTNCLPIFDIPVYCTTFASLRMPRKAKDMTDEDFVAHYANNDALRLAAIKHMREAFENEYSLFLVELKQLSTINLH